MSLFINSMNAYVEISMAFVLKKKGKKARTNKQIRSFQIAGSVRRKTKQDNGIENTPGLGVGSGREGLSKEVYLRIDS